MPSPHLLIRLLPGGAAEWLALRDGRVLAGPQAGLPAAGAERIDVIVPSEDVLLLRAPRVARQRRQLEQAVPFAIEEQLAAPVETLHVALADAAGDSVPVAVAAQARLDAWLAPLRAAGLEPDRVIPEAWLLPYANGEGTLLIDGQRAVLRHAEAGAFAGDAVEAADWIALLESEGRLPRLRAIAPAGVAVPARVGEREDPGALLPWFAQRLPHAGGLNLLQGRHAPRRGREGTRKLWRLAAVLAAAALIASFAALALERAQLEARRAEQRAEMEQLLRSALPGVARIVDPKAQLSAAYARGGEVQGQGALPLLARIAPLLAGSGRYTIDAIEFRADTLELTLRTSDVAALDALRESLANLPRLDVEVTGANPGSGGIEGRLRIRSRA